MLSLQTLSQHFIVKTFSDQIFIRRAFAGQDRAARIDE